MYGWLDHGQLIAGASVASFFADQAGDEKPDQFLHSSEGSTGPSETGLIDSVSHHLFGGYVDP